MPFRVCLGALILGCTVSAAAAQQVDVPSTKGSAEAEATLPEVVVRPGEQPAATAGGEPSAAPSPRSALSEMISQNYPSPLDQDVATLGLTPQKVFDLPASITVRTRQRLDEMAPATTPDALQEEVGVLIQKTNLGGGSPFIRGLTGNQVLILVDGIRLNNSTFRFGPNQYLNTIDPGQIERIEVIRGPQSVLYGSDAIGGVINVVTRSAEGIGCPEFGGSMVQRFSSSDTGLYNRLNVEATFDRSGIFAGGSYLDLNNLDPGGSAPRQQFTGYEQSAADLKFDYMLDRSSLLTVAVQHLVQHDVPRTDKFVTANESFIFDPQERELYYLRWQGTDLGGVVDAYRVTASFQRQQEGLRRQKFGSTKVSRYLDDVRTAGVELVAASDVGLLGRLTYGAQWYYDEIGSRRVDINTLTSAVTPGPSTFPDGSRYSRFGLFLQDEIDLAPRLTGIGGVRYSDIVAGSTPLIGMAQTPTPIEPSFQDWSGTFGLVYEIDPCVHLVGSASQGFRSPDLDDLTGLRATNQGIDIPSPGLQPETSWNYEVGLKADFERFRGQIFGFLTNLDGLIVRVPAGFQVEGTDAYVKENIDEAQIDGIELAGEYLLDGRWSFYGNFAYTEGRNLTQHEPVSRIPPAQGIAGIRWRNDGRYFEIYEWIVDRQDRLSARDIDDPRIPPGGTPGYHTLNLRAGRRWGNNSNLALGLENVLDRHYRVHGSGIDAPGITFTLGYELFY